MTKLKRDSIIVGEYRYYDSCRFCLKKGLSDFIDFGYVPLAGGFLKSDSEFSKERLYPFAVSFCSRCGLVQGRYVVDKSILFEDYFYRSSAISTLAEHFSRYAEELAGLMQGIIDPFAVEIGSNDGVFLRPLKKQGFRTLGIDPALNIVKDLDQKETPTWCAYFGEQTAKKIVKSIRQADLIVTSNSFAHIDDMHDVMRGVTALLSPGGLLCVENQYIGTLIKEFQYDLMYHEHMSYYCLRPLQSLFAMYGMEIFDVRPIAIHASLMRYYVQFQGTGKRSPTTRLQALLKKEKTRKLTSFSTFKSYSAKIDKSKKDLLSLLKKLKKQGKRIAGYGASGRATMVMSYCGITADHLDYIIDDAPAKQGAFMPGNHLPIVSSQILADKEKRPDYCLLFAWSFADEIIKRNQHYLKSKGKFIVPLPRVGILPK